MVGRFAGGGGGGGGFSGKTQTNKIDSESGEFRLRVLCNTVTRDPEEFRKLRV